ncbi:general transcription factor 3C polypeptide 6 isoform X2 [Eptesicus fuscus]|uniref:general transcription factor 3C polypeptide 6 isoform X2 n=1 Tax=Eptesicus fuscus TaxID=29078 RepID=UPI0024041810|nr:general transcription factor 3C polypeptide 6 isoform X2 [Eptesicus fuscus]
MAAAVERSPRDGEEEEEQLVLVELSGIIDSDFLSKCENKCKILGIDTERPILQVDSYVFAGEYEDTLGTCVIFEENVEHVDAEGNNKTVLKYKCHTMKKLSMTRTLLTEKKEGEESIGREDMMIAVLDSQGVSSEDLLETLGSCSNLSQETYSWKKLALCMKEELEDHNCYP